MQDKKFGIEENRDTIDIQIDGQITQFRKNSLPSSSN